MIRLTENSRVKLMTIHGLAMTPEPIIRCDSYHSQPVSGPLSCLVVQPLKTKRAAVRQINKRGTYGYHESHCRHV